MKTKQPTLYAQLSRAARKVKLPIVLHRGGKGKPGSGSAWSVSSLYPVAGKPYPGHVSGHAPTLPGAVRAFIKSL
jgi:hypothetical protein